ncbi:S1C family serine protease [soil metagenome]
MDLATRISARLFNVPTPAGSPVRSPTCRRFGQRTLRTICAVILASAALGAYSAELVTKPADPADKEVVADAAQVEALTKANAAVVGVRVLAVEDAASAQSLGKMRAGSGVVIGNDGLVLTIGYLILEADSVELVLAGDKVVPARVVAYDQATGFGLVQALVPLQVQPAPLGSAGSIEDQEMLMVSSGGAEGQISISQMVGRRGFSGYWEYHIDGAVFTAPPRTDHSGAALFNQRGELVGIGSLLVMDALGPGFPRMPGNMFVPIDLLKPILSEMRTTGASSQSHRAWLGVNCVEQAGQVRVLRVNDQSPAMQAGIQPGDRILKVDGSPVSDLAGFYQALWQGSTPERVVTLDIARSGEQQTLKVQALDRMKTLRRARGI